MTVETYHYLAEESEDIIRFHRMVLAFETVLLVLKQHPQERKVYTLQDLEAEKQYCIDRLKDIHNTEEPGAEGLPHMKIQAHSSVKIKRSDKPFT